MQWCSCHLQQSQVEPASACVACAMIGSSRLAKGTCAGGHSGAVYRQILHCGKVDQSTHDSVPGAPTLREQLQQLAHDRATVVVPRAHSQDERMWEQGAGGDVHTPRCGEAHEKHKRYSLFMTCATKERRADTSAWLGCSAAGAAAP